MRAHIDFRVSKGHQHPTAGAAALAVEHAVEHGVEVLRFVNKQRDAEAERRLDRLEERGAYERRARDATRREAAHHEGRRLPCRIDHQRVPPRRAAGAEDDRVFDAEVRRREAVARPADALGRRRQVLDQVETRRERQALPERSRRARAVVPSDGAPQRRDERRSLALLRRASVHQKRSTHRRIASERRRLRREPIRPRRPPPLLALQTREQALRPRDAAVDCILGRLESFSLRDQRSVLILQPAYRIDERDDAGFGVGVVRRRRPSRRLELPHPLTQRRHPLEDLGILQLRAHPCTHRPTRLRGSVYRLHREAVPPQVPLRDHLCERRRHHRRRVKLDDRPNKVVAADDPPRIFPVVWSLPEQ